MARHNSPAGFFLLIPSFPSNAPARTHPCRCGNGNVISKREPRPGIASTMKGATGFLTRDQRCSTDRSRPRRAPNRIHLRSKPLPLCGNLDLAATVGIAAHGSRCADIDSGMLDHIAQQFAHQA